MADTTAKEELHKAKDHAKDALLATLKAARGALDTAIQRLDDDAKADGDGADAHVPPATPGDERVGDDLGM